MTAREEVERLMGRYEQEQAAKPAKVGKRYQTAAAHPPSHWRKTLKLWAIVVLIYIGLSMLGGMVAGIIERVWP